MTDDESWRITCFATNTATSGRWRLADLEVRHRHRARAEDRIRNLKDTGLPNLPFHGFTQNQIWLEIIALAADLLTWTQTLGFGDHQARRWDPRSCDSASWPWPDASSEPAADNTYDYPAAGPGTTSSTPAGRHSNTPEQPTHTDDRDTETGGPSAGNTPCPPRRHTTDRRSPLYQAATRKIEARVSPRRL